MKRIFQSPQVRELLRVIIAVIAALLLGLLVPVGLLAFGSRLGMFPFELGAKTLFGVAALCAVAIAGAATFSLGQDGGAIRRRARRIAVGAALAGIPLSGERTLIHLGYSHEYGLVSRVAMFGYLNTLGRGKVGFSVVGRDSQGRPIYVRGLQGMIERNATRYHLAVQAFLDGRIGFTSIAAVVEKTLSDVEMQPIATVDDVVAVDTQARAVAHTQLGSSC